MPVSIANILLRLRLLRELVGKEFSSTERMEFEVLAKIEEIVEDRAYPNGYYAVHEYGVTVFEALCRGMLFRIYFTVVDGRVRIVWTEVAS
jgi:hypothetical protein